jgi:hypothetical protein
VTAACVAGLGASTAGSLLAIPTASAVAIRACSRLRAFYRWCADTAIPELHWLAATTQAWWPPDRGVPLTGVTNAASEASTG